MTPSREVLTSQMNLLVLSACEEGGRGVSVALRALVAAGPPSAPTSQQSPTCQQGEGSGGSVTCGKKCWFGVAGQVEICRASCRARWGC